MRFPDPFDDEVLMFDFDDPLTRWLALALLLLAWLLICPFAGAQRCDLEKITELDIVAPENGYHLAASSHFGPDGRYSVTSPEEWSSTEMKAVYLVGTEGCQESIFKLSGVQPGLVVTAGSPLFLLAYPAAQPPFRKGPYSLPPITIESNDSPSPEQTVLNFVTKPGVTATLSKNEIVAAPESSLEIQKINKRHAHFIRGVQSCEERKWPVSDPICHGYALSLAHWFVIDHPEYFGPGALGDVKKTGGAMPATR